jgi:hypothetical protein
VGPRFESSSIISRRCAAGKTTLFARGAQPGARGRRPFPMN